MRQVPDTSGGIEAPMPRRDDDDDDDDDETFL